MIWPSLRTYRRKRSRQGDTATAADLAADVMAATEGIMMADTVAIATAMGIAGAMRTDGIADTGIAMATIIEHIGLVTIAGVAGTMGVSEGFATEDPAAVP